MPTDLARLACGDPDTTSELGQVLTHIGTMIDTVMQEITAPRDRSDKHVTLYGPFLGRSLLDLSLTALIARFDPFRVLLIREMQRSPEYQAGVRLKTAIQWQGDVLGEAKILNLWSPEKSMDKVTRALLGDYFDHVIWRPACWTRRTHCQPAPGHRNYNSSQPSVSCRGFESKSERPTLPCPKASITSS